LRPREKRTDPRSEIDVRLFWTLGFSNDDLGEDLNMVYATLPVRERRKSFTSERLILASEIRFSEIIAALSAALDITQGHPQGHSVRSALIGMRIAEQINLGSEDRFALFYALLLKDLGCSSNAAKIALLFRGDDHTIKRTARLIDWTKPSQCLKHSWTNCAPGGSTVDKLKQVATIVGAKASEMKDLGKIRCDRGAAIAQRLQLPEATSTAIRHLDEHWDGRATLAGLKGDEISLLGRICCLSQTVEVFFSVSGFTAALDVAQQRRGTWFDPELVDALMAFGKDTAFWTKLLSDDPARELRPYEPQDAVLLCDDDCLDRVAEAFAMVVDAKSPWTYQHSTRVAEIAVGVAQQLSCTSEVQRDLRRAALLHDVGKLGVSNAILDKPGKPTDAEFAEIRKHPDYTQRILRRVDAFATFADVAAAHHERLDGRGYHLRLGGSEIPWPARILAVADIYEAMTARRPYREAMEWDQVYDIMSRDAGEGVEPECLAALACWREQSMLGSRIDDQLELVERLMSENG